MAIAFRAANFASADGTAISVPLPAGTADGDALVLVITVYSTSATWTDPAGWTNLAGSDVYITHASLGRSKFYVKIASSETDPATTLSGTRRWAASIAGYTGVDQTTPADTTEGTGWSQNVASGTGAVTTTSLTASAGQWLVAAACGTDDTTHTWTNDGAERTDEASPVVGAAVASSSLADTDGPVTGAVTITFTPSVSMQQRAAVALLLTEAAAVSNAPIPRRIFGTVW